MTDELTVRLADPDRDAAAVASIYRPAVELTAASFEEVAPDESEMAGRIRRVLAGTPWLVAESGGRVIGYAYAAPHRKRAGYRWSVDVSAYVHPDWHRRRVGRTLYDALLPLLLSRGFVNVYAGIALPNPASVALHESIGMRRIGVFERVGFKFGAWHDVAWYGVRIAEPTGQPDDPIPVPELPARP
jgi:L-amino acid N-acyltransferase YncA